MPRQVTMRSVHKRELSAEGTAVRILESAIALFAARGFSEVTVRDIADAAGANPAAISYYFGAKEALIKEALRAVIAPINIKRLAALAEVTDTGRRFGVEDVVRAMVEPTVAASMLSTGIDRHYARMLVLGFALRQSFVEEVMAEQTDIVAQKFTGALAVSLPLASKASLFWRYDFMVGAIQHILLDRSRGYRLGRVSGGLVDTDSMETTVDQLVSFISAGFKAAVR